MKLREYAIKHSDKISDDAKCLVIDEIGTVVDFRYVRSAVEKFAQSDVITAFSQTDLAGNDHIIFIYVKELV